MDEADFRQQLRDEGYDEGQLLELGANLANDMHRHDFAAFALVLSGEFTLVTEQGAVTHLQGETCWLDAGTLHCEQAGATGVSL